MDINFFINLVEFILILIKIEELNMAIIKGTSGNDNVVGTSGTDTIYGYDGNDILDGKGGVDTVNAGAGSDILIFKIGENTSNTSNDSYDGGSGSDTLRIVVNLNNVAEANQLVNIENAFASSNHSRTLNLANSTGGLVRLSVINTEKLNFSLNATTTEDQAFNISAAKSTDTIVLNYSGSAHITASNGIITYDPTGGFNSLAAGEQAQDSFSYSVYRGSTLISTATTTFTITGANDAPAAQNINVSAHEDGSAITANFLAIDPDHGSALTYNITSQPAEGSITNNGNGTFTFNPGADFQYLGVGESKIVSVNYTATDNEGATSAPATINITVTGTNDAPVVSDLSTIYDLTYEDEPVEVWQAHGKIIITDPDANDHPIFTPLTDVSGNYGTLSLDVNGNWIYNRDDSNPLVQSLSDGEWRLDVFTATAQSGNDTISQNIYVYVIGTNDAPVSLPSIFSTPTNQVLTLNASQLASDIDASDTLTVTNIDSSGTLGRVTLNADGSISYDSLGAFGYLTEGQNASDSFVCTIDDGNGGTVSTQVTVNIMGVNDAPVGDSTINLTVREYQNVSISASDLLTNAYDPEGEGFSLTGVASVSSKGGNVSFDGTTITYTPYFYAFNSLETGETGTDTFTYTLTDSSGASRTCTANVTVEGVSTPPTAYSRTYVISEDAADGTIVNTYWLASDSEDKYNLNFTITHGNNGDAFAIQNGNVVVNNQAALDFNTQPIYNLSVQATDSTGLHHSAIITIKLAPNDTNIVYVNQAATGADDGSSWSNAYTNLHDALENATAGQQIWVAKGTYTPIDGIAQADLPANSQTVSFQMVSGVEVYGGFAGNETSLLARNVSANPTILSGNIGDPLSASDNSDCIVRAASSSTLDGFTIRDADSSSGITSSGAVSCLGVNNFTIANSTFVNNHAINGGALVIDGASTHIDVLNSMFVDNRADGMGGAVYNLGANVTFSNDVFANNSATNDGGAIHNNSLASATPTEIINSTFNNNYSASGAAVATFSDVDITNSILWGDQGYRGTEIYVSQSGSSGSAPNVNVMNSDISGGLSTSGATVYNSGGTINDNGGNFNVDPLFVDAANPLTHGLALLSVSPLIDAGQDLPDLLGTDIIGSPRVLDKPPMDTDYNVVDMGAYEYKPPYDQIA